MKQKNLLVAFFLMLAFQYYGQVQKQPKIVVGVVIDQMCYDYLYRFQHLYTSGGFNRLMNKGTNCRNVQYNYVPTYTAPGHASIYTGTTPSNHGIIGNDWYVRDTKQNVTSVSNSKFAAVGGVATSAGAAPLNLRTYTITDQLKMASPKSKVISVSIKDRSAILPGGHLSDGTYWYDYNSGDFITSTFYMPQLPDWVQRFNAKFDPAKDLHSWKLLLPESTYQMPDQSNYEVVLTGKTSATFPYDFQDMIAKGAVANNLFTISPQANEILTELAITALEQENLGQDQHTDFLCISYSTPDIAGHAFGPYSREMEDMYARLDRELQRLFSSLETRYGKDGFVLFLTADHAVVPVPQMLIEKKLPGGYFFLDNHLQVLRDDFILKYNADLLEYEINQNIYLNLKRIDSLKLDVQEVAEFAANELRKWPEVKTVLTRQELLSGAAKTDFWGEMLRNGFDLQRSGEVIFLLQPGYLAKEHDEPKAHQGTSHGSAFNYDTHVPLLWYGKGITPGLQIFDPIQITDIAPTIIHILNLQRSGSMIGQPILPILEE
ncbi:MAG: alkaline phosphatase family protein [Flavobacteriales bacterium]